MCSLGCFQTLISLYIWFTALDMFFEIKIIEMIKMPSLIFSDTSKNVYKLLQFMNVCYEFLIKIINFMKLHLFPIG